MNFWKQSIAIGAAIAFGTITTALLVPLPDLPPMVAEISFKNAKKSRTRSGLTPVPNQNFPRGVSPARSC
jgi:hypothetical protein